MTSAGFQQITDQTRRPWGPTWARVLVYAALVPAGLTLVAGVLFFIQGFHGESLDAIGLVVGPTLVMLALIITLPAVAFLRVRGKVLFAITMCTLGILLALVTYAAL